MNHDSIADHKKSWDRELYYLQVLEEVLSLLQGTAPSGQGRRAPEKDRPGAYASSINVCGWHASGKPHRGSYLSGTQEGGSVGRRGRDC